MCVIWSMFACNPSKWKSQYLLAFSSTWLCWKCFLLWFFCCICLYLLYSPTAQGSVASAPPPTAPPIAPPPAAAAGERSRVIVFVRGGNHHHYHSPVSRETSFPLETLCRIRPDICHEYHKLYSWRKNCHVEKFWEILPQFTRFHVEVNWAQKIHLWRKNDRYEVWEIFALISIANMMDVMNQNGR